MMCCVGFDAKPSTAFAIVVCCPQHLCFPGNPTSQKRRRHARPRRCKKVSHGTSLINSLCGSQSVEGRSITGALSRRECVQLLDLYSSLKRRAREDSFFHLSGELKAGKNCSEGNDSREELKFHLLFSSATTIAASTWSHIPHSRDCSTC